ncbi:MAG: PIN domain-containing protein [Chloroflexota bacterium]
MSNTPYRNNHIRLQNAFKQVISNGKDTQFVHIDDNIGIRASRLRATYNLKLPDALQAAVAITVGCDVFLTNDEGFKKVTELRTAVIKELELPSSQIQTH